MKIKIAYDSKFSLSTMNEKNEVFLTGMSVLSENPNKDTVEIFKKENSFLENIKELNKYYPNYKYADITKNTILGILCRLIGEVRRVDVLDENHPIIKIKNQITFDNFNKDYQNEVMNLHTKLKEVQNGAGGLISKENENHFLLTNNNISENLMNVFSYKDEASIIDYLYRLENDYPYLLNEVYGNKINPSSFIIEMVGSDELTKELSNLNFTHDNFSIASIVGRHFWGETSSLAQFVNFYKGYTSKVDALNLEIKDKKNNSRSVIKSFEILKAQEMEQMKSLKLSLKINEIFNIGGFLFNRKIAYLLRNSKDTSELKNSINSKNTITGLAFTSGALTIKDFYNNFVEDKKVSFTMPYSVELRKDLFVQEDLKEFNIGTKVGVTKESGELVVNIDISKDEAIELYKKMEAAGVSTFQLGKKGLAYVESIELENL